MSVQAIAWALDVKTGNPGAKIVLLCLANYADETGVCWPSQATIAAQSEQSLDTVQRRLVELVELGLVEKRRRGRKGDGGGRASDIYQLLLPTMAARGVKPQPAAKGVKPQKGGVKPHCCGLHIDEPSLRTTNVISSNLVDSLILRGKEDSEERSSLWDEADLFGEGHVELKPDRWPEDWEEQFRARYPRRVSMLAAIAKLGLIQKKGKVTFEEIMDGVDRYARSVEGQDMKFVCHPTTWLNQGRWEDEEKALDTSESNGNNGFCKIVRDFAGVS